VRVETILNNCYRHKSFVYVGASIEMAGARKVLVVDIEARRNGRARCSVCGGFGAVYDHGREPRVFDFVPLWNIPVWFRYTMRRVQCRRCGVKVEKVPWAEGNEHMTKPFQLFLARWARKLSWKDVARAFGVSWDCVYRSVKAIVKYGLAHRDLDGITAIGVDEVHQGKGGNFLTLVYQIDAGLKRLLYVGRDRTAKSLLRFFHELGRERCERLRFICTDMWKPYLKVTAKKAKQALLILDRFHIVQNLNKALDKIRASEARRLKEEGYEDVLKHAKYCFLKNERNLTDNQRMKLKDVMQYDLKSVRAYLLKESFQLFWAYQSPYWAAWYLKKWCARAMRSRLKPIQAFVKTIRRHQPLILNWFRAKKAFSCGVVEGLNRKVNLVTRKAFGFRSFEVLQIALYHTMGDLPEPSFTHSFY
jgi:transposase